jgi:hypothetical protein
MLWRRINEEHHLWIGVTGPHSIFSEFIKEWLQVLLA